jgi:hypothetical protein
MSVAELGPLVNGRCAAEADEDRSIEGLLAGQDAIA